MMLTEEKRGIEEAYTSAGNSSDMRVEAEVRGDADMIIAAGWSPSRVGMALLRLHSEWDMAAKPKKPNEAAILALAQALPRKRIPFVLAGPELRRQLDDDLRNRVGLARKQAADWHAREMLNLIGKLGSLQSVRKQLTEYVPKWGIKEAGQKVPAIIAYWLDQVCHSCHGLKFMQIADTPTLSTKACRACHGTGVSPIPYGGEGKRVANYMDDCVQRARTSIKHRLHEKNS